MTTNISTADGSTPRATTEIPAAGLMLKSSSMFNARVLVLPTPTGLRVIKDFSHSPFLVRQTLGRFLIRREWATLRRLQGVLGVPVDPVRLHSFALSYRYVPGDTLSSVQISGSPLDQTFFFALEQLVAGLHARGFVHLDLRNGKNILRTAKGQPYLLDFQAGVWLGLVPALLRRPFEAVDMSGVYKWWSRLAPGQMNAHQTQSLRTANRWRQLWRFNYPDDDHRLRR